jgi:hypothetical protein
MYEAREGLQVVCIKKFRDVIAGQIIPVVGQILTIREIIKPNGTAKDDHPCFLRFYEIKNKPSVIYQNKEICFGSNNFRPVKKTDISDFTKLLKKAPLNKSFEHSDFEIII